MKRFFAFATMITLLYACKPGIPKDVLQPDKMRLVLLDVHLVDGYITGFTNQDSSKKVAATFYKAIYKKFGTDSAQYNRSLDYYYTKPALFKQIYDSVTAKLNVLKEETIQAISVDSEHEFRGIFDANLKDSTQYDPTLKKDYNYRYLVLQKYGNLYKSASQASQINIRSTPTTTVPDSTASSKRRIDSSVTTVAEPELKQP
ncbi:MAG: DUF4296 domain-containing protein [Flavobacterium sp.]|nr:MAG: DUF4296 domain-containing protein [Flavobacterium sp.]